MLGSGVGGMSAAAMARLDATDSPATSESAAAEAEAALAEAPRRCHEAAWMSAAICEW